jgi:mRNA-degrading endonuclease YafQ of YafQ-DinJ toxin-antitoxin module
LLNRLVRLETRGVKSDKELYGFGLPGNEETKQAIATDWKGAHVPDSNWGNKPGYRGGSQTCAGLDRPRSSKKISGAWPVATIRDCLICCRYWWRTDTPLDPKHRNHPLVNTQNGLLGCHVRGDLVLLHQKPDADTAKFYRPGSHAELGLA